MDVFSLEEAECNALLITQSDTKIDIEDKSVEILLDGNVFQSLCISLLSQQSANEAVYEDISDAEDFKIPSSQVSSQVNRWNVVFIWFLFHKILPNN